MRRVLRLTYNQIRNKFENDVKTGSRLDSVETTSARYAPTASLNKCTAVVIKILNVCTKVFFNYMPAIKIVTS